MVAEVWLEFVAVALAIAIGGYRLSRCGDVIGGRAGLSGSWIGLVLLATVTSLPERVSGVTPVTVQRSPDLAVDDIAYDGPLLSDASAAHAITLFSTMIANGLVAAGLIYRSEDRPLRAVSWTSLGLVLVFGVNVWLLSLATGKLS